MNLASAGPLLCIWLARRTPEGGSIRDSLGRTLAWSSVWAFLLGMLTGGVLLYFPPSAGLNAAIDRLPARGLWFAASELLFSLVCLLLYAGCWHTLRRHRWWHATLSLLSCSNLLYHFPPLMSVLGKLAANPRWAKAEVLDRATLLPLMQRSEILALSAHFIIASLAVSAIAVLWLVSKSTNGTDLEESPSQLARGAASIALLASGLQFPVGIWLLVTLPRASQSAMMGDSAVASFALVGAMVLTFVLLQRLLTIAISPTQPAQLRSVGWILVVIVLLMTTTLQSTRVQRRTKSKQERSREANSSTASVSILYDHPISVG